MTTAVIALKDTASVARAEAEMGVAGFRHLPVVDSGNNLVGVLSNRDLLRARRRPGAGSLPIGKVMTAGVLSVRPATPAHEAVEMMIEHKIGSLPVVGDDGKLVGIITETDFLVVAQQALRGLPISLPRASA
jgi:CBS domain-containing protein